MTTGDDSNLYPFTPPPPPPATAPGPQRRAPRPGSKLTRTAAGLAVVLGAGAGAAAVAQAATSGNNQNTSSTATSSSRSTAPARPWGPMQRFFGSGRFGGLGSPGMLGPMGAVHGQFTVPNGNSGYETIATQVGTVQSVSSGSITVKSADGYSQDYVVNSSTLVNADYEGILSVKTGDTVAIEATVSGSTYTAQRVTDTTQVQANRKSWVPQPATTPPTPFGPGSPAA